MKILNNCDELIEFVCNELADYPGDIVEFQGDTLEVTKTDLSYEEIGVIKGDVLILILMEHAQRASISLSYLYQ